MQPRLLLIYNKARMNYCIVLKCIYTVKAWYLQEPYHFKLHRQSKSEEDISFSIDTIKHFFGKIGQKFTLEKKTDNPAELLKSSEATIN